MRDLSKGPEARLNGHPIPSLVLGPSPAASAAGSRREPRRRPNGRQGAGKPLVHEDPGFVPPVARLFDLANPPFQAAVFQAAWEAIAPFDARSSDDNLGSFPFDRCGEPRLIVAVGEDLTEADGAVLSICWWATSLRRQHDTAASFATERSEFDRRFHEACAASAARLGPPLLSGADPGTGYRHAVWRGRTGLLVVQQSDDDCRFGEDINSWVRRWSGPDPRPTSPFIDWLTKQSGP